MEGRPGFDWGGDIAAGALVRFIVRDKLLQNDVGHQ